MSSVRKPNKAAESVPCARRRTSVWLAATGAAVVLAVGGWWLGREKVRADERSEALAAGYDQLPDAGERLTACLARDPNDVVVLETLVVWSLRGGAVRPVRAVPRPPVRTQTD